MRGYTLGMLGGRSRLGGREGGFWHMRYEQGDCRGRGSELVGVGCNLFQSINITHSKSLNLEWDFEKGRGVDTYGGNNI